MTERPHTEMVEFSNQMIERFEDKWSEPMHVRIRRLDDGTLTMEFKVAYDPEVEDGEFEEIEE